MNTTIKRTNLLILQGIYPEDFDKNNNKEKDSNKSVYTNIPKCFIDVESWPKESNLRCWECDQLNDSYPKFIPCNIETIYCNGKTKQICETYGHFDTWNCAISYILKEFPQNKKWDTLQLLYIFESKFSNNRKKKIPKAPPKTIMKQYCGDKGITIQEYKERIKQLNEENINMVYKLDHSY